tara:strand:+ start:70 stop:210 length:141 start_codon:yes stop_codon:yes gene_type:complete
VGFKEVLQLMKILYLFAKSMEQIKIVEIYDNILVIEDHLIDGGFCS